MIVKCDQCSTKFKLDDAKIKNEGVKVRCSKCKHIFEVKKETPQDEPDFDSILSGLDSPPPQPGIAPPSPVAAPPGEDFLSHGEVSQPSFSDDTATVSFGADVPHNGTSPDDFSFDDRQPDGLTGSTSEESEASGNTGEFDFGDISFGDTAASAAQATDTDSSGPVVEDDFSFGDFNFGQESADISPEGASIAAPATATENASEESNEFDFGDFAFSDEPATTTGSSAEEGDASDQDATLFLATTKVAQEEGGLDFGNFAFDEPKDAPAEAGMPDVAPGFDATAKQETFDNFPAGEDMDEPLPSFTFGDSTAEPARAASSNQGSDELSFDDAFTATSATDDFFGEESTPSAERVEPMLIPPSDISIGKAVAPEGDSFDFGSFDFGDSAPDEASSLPPVNGAPFPSAPAAAGIAPEVPSAPPLPVSSPLGEEAPPLSIATRRRESRSIPYAVLGICGLLVAVIFGGGYYLYSKGASAFDTVGLGSVAKLLGIDAAEEGAIALKNPSPAFIMNQQAGELFVVTGEAVNNYKKPRASIQVRVTLYGPKGEVVQQKTAYCGNALTKEQLTVMPFTKIEAAMNNQFGDSLANLGVKPGKGIPFVVVLSQVPKTVGEYGLEVVSSTVASQ